MLLLAAASTPIASAPRRRPSDRRVKLPYPLPFYVKSCSWYLLLCKFTKSFCVLNLMLLVGVRVLVGVRILP